MAAFILICVLPWCVSASGYAPGTVKVIETHDIPDYAAIDGDNIIWTRYGEVNLYSLMDNKTIEIAGGDYFQLNSARISGDYIIWTERDESKAGLSEWDLYLYTISTGEREIIPTEENAPVSIDIDGKYIVWKESDKVYLYDIDERDYHEISGIIFYIGHCTVDGDIVAWEGTDNAGSPTNDLYTYNITEKSTEIVTDLPGFRDGFYLHDGKIIWSDRQTVHSKSVIREYNTETGNQSEITTVDDYAAGFSISKDLFVYTNFGFWSTDTPDSRSHLINLTTGADVFLNQAENGYRGVSISGNNMVWPEENVVLFTYDPSGEPINRDSIFSALPQLKFTPGFTWILASMSVLAVFFFRRYR